LDPFYRNRFYLGPFLPGPFLPGPETVIEVNRFAGDRSRWRTAIQKLGCPLPALVDYVFVAEALSEI